MDADLVEGLSPENLGIVRRSNRELFEHFWSMGGTKIIVLNPLFPGIIVPGHLRSGTFILMYDACPVVPIPDLRLTDLGIEATLSFDRSPHETFVPWEAIDGMGPTQEPAAAPRLRSRLQLV